MRFVILGGGIAGVSCAEEISRLCKDSEIIIVSASKSIKNITNYVRLSEHRDDFDVVERPIDCMASNAPNLRAMYATVSKVDHLNKKVYFSQPELTPLWFDKLCIATGGRPKVLLTHERIIGIRDTYTVESLRKQLGTDCKRVAVVGNGAIAMELVHAIQGPQVIWIIKDSYMGSTFFDSSASRFFEDAMAHPRTTTKRQKSNSTNEDVSTTALGSSEKHNFDMESFTSHENAAPFDTALGPGWLNVLQGSPENARRSNTHAFDFSTGHDMCRWSNSNVNILRNTWVTAIKGNGTARTQDLASGEWIGVQPPTNVNDMSRTDSGDTSTMVSELSQNDSEYALSLKLRDGSIVSCDLVVCAMGIIPNVDFIDVSDVNQSDVIRFGDISESVFKSSPGQFQVGPNGGLIVSRLMETTGSQDIYAAGDCAHVSWPESKLWFQMNLWGQARLQGLYTATCMAGYTTDPELAGAGFNFELFSHVTNFYGYKVVLLGMFNGQRLDKSSRTVIRKCEATETGVRGMEPATQTDKSHSVGLHGNQLIDITNTEFADLLRSAKVQVHYRVSLPSTVGNENAEYIKLVLLNGRVVGAVLVGNTDLEETCENLILNGLNVGDLEIDILNPDIDIEDYFD